MDRGIFVYLHQRVIYGKCESPPIYHNNQILKNNLFIIMEQVFLWEKALTLKKQKLNKKPLYNWGNSHFLRIISWTNYKQLHILERGPLVLGNEYHSPWLFSNPILKLCSGQQGLPSFFFFPATDKQAFFFLREWEMLTQESKAVALTGTTIKNKHPNLNFPSYCPFQQSLKYFLGPDTTLILSIAAGDYTVRFATVKTRLGRKRRM